MDLIEKYLCENILNIYDENNEKIDSRKLKFTANNIKKIAKEYDATIIDIEIPTKFAKLKDNIGRTLIVQWERK